MRGFAAATGVGPLHAALRNLLATRGSVQRHTDNPTGGKDTSSPQDSMGSGPIVPFFTERWGGGVFEQNEAMVISVVGAGSWGTALAIVLARNGHTVRLIGRESSDLDSLASVRENLRYLPGFALPEGVTVHRDTEALAPGDMVVEAVPSGTVQENLDHFAGYPVIVVASKGLAPENDGVLSDDLEQAYPEAKVVALSGPNLAVELAKGVPTAAISAGRDLAAAELVRGAFQCSSYRVYISDDVKGVQLAGALKNVMAIGAGVGDGLGYGDNTKGAFLARGLNEMTRLGVAMGAKAETFYGIAGVGDLFATASSRLSRNYRVGYALGEGKSLEAILADLGQVAEGVPTCEIAVRLARKINCPVPIMESTLAIVQGKTSPRAAVARLMEGVSTHENVAAPR